MASNNVSLGELIHQVGERNKELLSTDPLGVSIDKEFMPSVANTIGTDLSKYMLLRRNRFACNPMHVGRDRALPIARYKKDVPGIVSPAYMTFEADEDRVDLDYLELFFKLAVFDKECWFYTDSSVRGGLSWDALCSIELNLPSFDEQRKIAAITKVIRGRMAQLAEQNDYLEELALSLYIEKLEWPQDELPTGWSYKPLSDFFPVKTGKKDANIATPDGTYPFFTCAQGNLLTDDYSFDGTAILVAGNGDFNVKWYEGKFEAYQRTYVLMLQEPALLGYLYCAVKRNLTSITCGARGSVIKFITKGNIADYKIAVPPNPSDNEYVQKLRLFLKTIDANKKEIAALAELRDTLLPKLMSGEIDVSKVDLTQLNNHFL